VFGGLLQDLAAPATHVPEALHVSPTVHALLSALHAVPEGLGEYVQAPVEVLQVPVEL